MLPEWMLDGAQVRRSLSLSLQFVPRLFLRMVGMDGLVIEPAVLLGDFANVDILDRLAGVGTMVTGPRGLCHEKPLIAAMAASPLSLPSVALSISEMRACHQGPSS